MAAFSRLAIPPDGWCGTMTMSLGRWFASLFCSKILSEELLPIVRPLRDTGLSKEDHASPVDHDIILLSPDIVQT
jgi:hypothetical protein